MAETKSTYIRILASIILVALSVISMFKIIDSYGESFTNDGFERSLVAFAIAKGLNGAISIVQGTEIALEPAGIGVILTPGQVLDPVNDLIERFSWVMLLCSTSLGIQSIILKIFSSQLFSIVVGILLLFTCYFVWINNSITIISKPMIYKLVSFLVILRFCIPVMAITSEAMYSAFLEPEYEKSKQHLEGAGAKISSISNENINYEEDKNNYSWYESLTKNIGSTIEAFDVDRRIEQLKIEAESITKNVINLIVVFTLQTILFPLVFLWLTVKLIKSSLSMKY